MTPTSRQEVMHSDGFIEKTFRSLSLRLQATPVIPARMYGTQGTQDLDGLYCLVLQVSNTGDLVLSLMDHLQDLKSLPSAASR